MSFRILNDDEKKFLDEHQLRVYNEEYEVYLERNRLVDRLETLGKIKKPEFRAEIKNIRPVAVIREKKYTDPHFDIPDIRSRINIKAPSVLPHRFILPELPVPGIDTKTAAVPELRKSIRSEVSLSCMPDTGIQLPGASAFRLPEHKVSGINTDVSAAASYSCKIPLPVLHGTEDINRNFKAASYSFKAPENTKPFLRTYVPKAHVTADIRLPDSRITGFVKPEVDSVAVIHFTLPEFRANIPEISIGAVKNTAAFEDIKVQTANIPVLSIDKVPAAEYKAVEAAVDIPEINISKPKRYNTFRIEIPEIDMPEFSTDKYSGRVFDMPEMSKVSLHTDVASAPVKTYHTHNYNAFGAEFPEINIPEFSTDKYSGRVFDMPEMSKVSLHTDVASAPLKAYRTHNYNAFSAELPEIDIPEFCTDKYSGRGFDMPEMSKVSLHTNVASAPVKTYRTHNYNAFGAELPEINIPEFKAVNTSYTDFEVHEIRKIPLETKVKTFAEKKLEIPDTSVEIEKSSVSSPEEIIRGIEMYSKKFNDILALMGHGTSNKKHTDSKQKEIRI